MSEFVNELIWKNDNPFFINLNKNIELLRLKMLEANKNLIRLDLFLNEIISFKGIYLPYLIGEKDWDKSFKDAKEYIRSLDYRKFTTKNRRSEDEYRIAIDNLDKLNDVVEKMIYNLSKNNILPKIVKKKKFDPKTAISNTTY